MPLYIIVLKSASEGEIVANDCIYTDEKLAEKVAKSYIDDEFREYEIREMYIEGEIKE